MWEDPDIFGALWGCVGNYGERVIAHTWHMLLTGTFSRSIDQKSRIAIPKRLREALACTHGGVLYVAPSTDRSLAIYTEDSFGDLAQRLKRSSPTEQHVRAFTRLFFAAAQQVDLDTQGRIRIPSELVQVAALQKEVVLLGVQDHLEVWASERWQAYLTEKQSHFDEIAEAAFGPING